MTTNIVVFAKMRSCAAIVILAIIAAPSAHGQAPPDGSPALTDLHPNLWAIDDATRQIRTAGCHDRQCRSILLVARAIDIMEAAMVPTMGVTKPLPPNLPQIIGRRWRKEILSHPDLFPAVCDTIVGLAARYDGTEFDHGDRLVATGVIELAARMDSRKGACLPRVMAAFQRIPAADTAIEIARGACPHAWKPWGAPCDRIAR
jgi:hypothetical protein